jgi:hypothetical protein
MSDWQHIETAPDRKIVLVCNPKEGFVPAVAKRVSGQWYNIGVVLIGLTAADYRLDPQPLFWMPIPDMPE